MMSSPSSSPPVSIIDDRYVLLARVGRGATGEVYKAFDRDSDGIVAVKLVDLEDAEDEVADIQREITLLSQCHSPYVTRYLSSALVKGTSKLAIVMEYVAGGSARHALDEAGARTGAMDGDGHDGGNGGGMMGGMSEGEIVLIMRDVLRALEYLHHEGKIHRDVKAANVLLTEKAEARLADFGVSGQMTHTIGARRKTFTGTPFWMAPEVIQGGEGYDEKADIWSLGITCYELATGNAPHSELHPMRVLFVIPKQDSPKLPQEGGFSAEFQDFVAQCLQKDANARPSAKELLTHAFLRTVDEGAFARLKARVDKHVALTESTLNASDTKILTEQNLRAPKPSWDFGDDSLGRKFTEQAPQQTVPETQAVPLTAEPSRDTGSEYGSSVYQSMGGTIRMANPPTETDEEGESLGDSMGAATIGTTSSLGATRDRYKLDEMLEQNVVRAPLMKSLILPALEATRKAHSEDAASSELERAIEALDRLEIASPGALSLFVQSMLRQLATSRDESFIALKTHANRLFGNMSDDARAMSTGGRSVLANYLLHRWQADMRSEQTG